MLKIQHLLGIGLAAAMFAAACSTGSTNQLDDTEEGDDDDGANKPGKEENENGGETAETPAGTTPPNGGTTDPPAGGTVPTNSEAGKAFYKEKVHPTMTSKCVSCHQSAGPGTNFLNADAETSYKALFVAGYVTQQSRVILKGPHGGLTTNVLTQAEITTYNDWVAMETKDGGKQAPPNVLANIGQCMDRQKFDAMQMQNWATIRRTNNNNQSGLPNNQWAENADNCTGCDQAPCRTCHTSDPATSFVLANGNPIVPSGYKGNIYNSSADYTFGETKLTNPNYIRQFFGTTPDGKAVASDGLKKKSESTKKDKKYTHPMYQLNQNQQAALDAFVNDAVTRYNAGQCGQTPAPTAP